MNDQQMKELRELISALHGKLDESLKNTATNTADIAWLKRGLVGMVSSCLAWVAAHLYVKIGG